MKINNECARKILFEVEKIPYGEFITVENLQKKISEFTLEDVLTIDTLFNKDHYLAVIDKVGYDDNDVLRDNKIKCLTERGYRTLDIIRNDDIWNLMRTKLDNFDDLSIYSIFDLANKISNTNQNKLFDLPIDLVVPSVRW